MFSLNGALISHRSREAFFNHHPEYREGQDVVAKSSGVCCAPYFSKWNVSSKPSHSTEVSSMLNALRQLIKDVDAMSFNAPVTHVYNPLRYAWAAHQQYLAKFGSQKGRILLLGMNPGPWGMAQTGIPFGEVASVSRWMGIHTPIGQPRHPHDKRPVQGFDCPRSEVSGRRVWTWAESRFGEPEHFFSQFFVHNYCPLMFLEESGRNRTPDKLPKSERTPLFSACDKALKSLIDHLEPKGIIGIGAFAEKRAKAVWKTGTMGKILHPSPASPAANRGWAQAAERQFEALGIKVSLRRQ